ncbi:2-amino-4-hydroxy-6-hydroxymethyldihydropteridine diphosphokinase [Cryobacterium sp. TMT1-3]|uniref:2-amino-4-hydroxy-6- hydroxymethyldihydropteridine diphosphokinase n=1 Tax=Cryobacterium sp. TMT1-3 TaxID=1259237 RepID=UPI00106A8D10|nr:2-amino-4-hydroxy-6-hydroxymethyldihydropteridine diphosphokinase [Cryobacterium sp. TMT1-3]TFC29571.1 2-amino-4-hydroxy-6-hydroxymethyldihydropteridine diphosphokinase [Cryobacterium sp. TMT1-3]
MIGSIERVVLALGSNLGDRAATLTRAAADISELPGATLVAVSPVYESAAVKPGGVDESAPRYFNAVLTIGYSGDPYALLDAVNLIEARHGRVRAERWGDRTLDIDLIVFGELRIDDDRLILPHPRAAERDFVLAPWLDLDAAAVIPGRGLVRDLLAATGITVRRVADASAAESAPAPGAGR